MTDPTDPGTDPGVPQMPPAEPAPLDLSGVQEASANISQIEQEIADGGNPKHKGDPRAESAAGQVEFEVGH